VNTVKLGQREIVAGAAPYIIAEMSGNHNHSLDRALSLVEAAAAAGAHAVKLQTYTADTMTLDCHGGDFTINDPASLWYGRTLHDLYHEAHTPWDWHPAIFQRGRELGLDVFSTPFDDTAVDFLETLDVPFYKIASFEATDLPLIRKVAATGKPMIVSTGLCSVSEIMDVLATVREVGDNDLVFLKCTSAYPAPPEAANLLTIPHLRDLTGCVVGLSDHTMGVGTAVAAATLGAAVIEKHFTLSRADGGVDAAFSLEPDELRALVEETERAVLSMGQVAYGAGKADNASLTYRRSIYVAKDIAEGETLTRDNTRIIRPGFGLAPRHFDEVLGCTAVRPLKKGTALQWQDIQS